MDTESLEDVLVCFDFSGYSLDKHEYTESLSMGLKDTKVLKLAMKHLMVKLVSVLLPLAVSV